MVVLTPPENMPPLKYILIRMINDASHVMKGRETEEGSYHAAG